MITAMSAAIAAMAMQTSLVEQFSSPIATYVCRSKASDGQQLNTIMTLGGDQANYSLNFAPIKTADESEIVRDSDRPTIIAQYNATDDRLVIAAIETVHIHSRPLWLIARDIYNFKAPVDAPEGQMRRHEVDLAYYAVNANGAKGEFVAGGACVTIPAAEGNAVK
jgi:hypothetical protein